MFENLSAGMRVVKNKRSQDCWSKWRRFGGHIFPYGISRNESKLFSSRDVHQRRGFGRAYSALPGPAASADFQRTCIRRRTIGVFLSCPSPGVTHTWGSGRATLALVSPAQSTPAGRLARRLPRACPGRPPPGPRQRQGHPSKPTLGGGGQAAAGRARPLCGGSPSIRGRAREGQAPRAARVVGRIVLLSVRRPPQNNRDGWF